MICTVNETYILNKVIHMKMIKYEIIFSYTNEMKSVLTKDRREYELKTMCQKYQMLR